MTSPNHQDADHSMFMSKTPCFFKVILEETLRDGVLGIPRKFVTQYGDQLSSPVKLEVPSGEIWPVELKKSDGRVVLQNGWPQFAEHYSLEPKSFVVFRYEGNNHFHVLIFDTSDTEIKYPYTTTEDDVSVSRKNKEKPDLHISLDDSEGELKLPAKDGGGRLSGARSLKPSTSAFRASNPSFSVVMHQSYIRSATNVHIPEGFAKRYLKKDGEMILRVNGRTWSVKCKRIPNSGHPRTVFRGAGLRPFVKDNELKVGDVCMFELIKENGNLLLEVAFQRKLSVIEID